MDELLQQLGAALGRVGSDPRVWLTAHVAAGYLITVWLACALWAFVDMRRRSGRLVIPYAIAAIVIVATPLLFPFALLLHAIVRPRIPFAERRLDALRERAMEAELELPTCAVCRRVIDADWLVCPACRTALAHRCEQCGGTVPIDWAACAWCGSSFDPPREAIRTAR